MSIALIAAGCGEDEAEQAEPTPEEQYVSQVNDAIAPTATEAQELFEQGSQARNPRDLVEPLRGLEETYRTAANDLEAIDPPEDAQEQHQRLIELNEGIADSFAEAQRQAERGNVEQALEGVRSEVDEYLRDATAISEQLRELGYEL